MEDLLTKFFILQKVSNKGRDIKLGRGYNNAYRLNPYNPFAYLFLVLYLIFGFLAYGVVGFPEKIKGHNPFTWD